MSTQANSGANGSRSEDEAEDKGPFIPRPSTKNTGPLLKCVFCKREFYFPLGHHEGTFFVRAVFSATAGEGTTRHFCAGDGHRSRDDEIAAWVAFAVDKGLSDARINAGVKFIKYKGGRKNCYRRVACANGWEAKEETAEVELA